MENTQKKRRAGADDPVQSSSSGGSTFSTPGRVYVPVVASARHGNDFGATTIGVFCSQLTAVRASIQYLLNHGLIGITKSGNLKKYREEEDDEEEEEDSEDEEPENEGEEVAPIDKFMKGMALYESERDRLIKVAVTEVNEYLPAREWDCHSYEFDIRCHDVNDTCDPAEGVILM